MAAAKQDGAIGQQVLRLDDAGAARVARLDYGTIGKLKRTPQGGVIAPARLTRTGVFVYRNHDGTERRELRLPEEVFHADALATLADAPVTDLHPPELVTPDTFRSVARGHVRGDAKQDGAFVAAELAIQDGALIAAAERGERRDVSCGYTCALEMKSGEHEGERYDAIQRGIRYNHVALVPKGRAGREVSLRLDAAEQVSSDDKGSRRHDAGEERKHAMKTMRIDGVDYEVGTPAFEQALAKHQARLDAELADAKAERDKLKGERDGLQTKLDKAEKDLKAATDPKAIADAVKARVALEADARSILGEEAKFDGKSDRDVIIAAIRHDDDRFEADDQTTVDYLRGRFESLVRKSREDAGVDGARRAIRDAKRRDNGGEDRDDRDDDRRGRRDDQAPDAECARRDMIEFNRKAHTQPFRFERKGG